MKRSPTSNLLLASLLALPIAAALRSPPERATDLFHEHWAYAEPALVAGKDGGAALAWLAFDGERDRVCASFLSDDGWSAMAEVAPESGVYLPPVVAAAGGSDYWIVWPARRDGAYDLFARRIGPNAGGPLELITNDAAPDTEPALAVGPEGQPVVAWQSLRDGNQEVLVAHRADNGWSEPVRVTEDPASDIQPSLAFDARGRAWVAWSTWRHGSYRDGNYEVYAALVSPEGASAPRRVSTSGRADLFPRFARVGERLGLVWTESLFGTRTIKSLVAVSYDQWRDKSYRVAWLEGDDFAEPLPVLVQNREGARLEVSDFARPVAAPNGRGLLLVHQTLFDKPATMKKWGLAFSKAAPSGVSTPRGAAAGVAGPGGRFDAAWVDGRLLAVDTASKRLDGDAPVAKRGSWLRVRHIDPETARDVRTLGEQKLKVESDAPAGLMEGEPPRGARSRVTVGQHELTAYFGNLHLHSDLSTDGRGHDGTPEMNYQVVHDLAELDFAGLSDHVEWWLAGQWWSVRKLADLWNRPGYFVTLYGYEWTSFKHGHKNVYFRDGAAADAGAEIRALGKTPDDLWELLGDRAALAIPHHPSHKVNEPTDWSYRNDHFQRLVEIFQVRGSSEFDGATYQRGRGDSGLVTGHSVQDALRMGHRLGIIASPDHGGGLGLAGAWADELGRASIYEALHARRTFGTTGAKMDLWLTVDGAPLGSELDHREGPVSLHAEVNATAEGLVLTVVSDGEDLASVEFDGRRAVLDWADERAPSQETRYYYLRARQGDGHMGWTSPVWVEAP